MSNVEITEQVGGSLKEVLQVSDSSQSVGLLDFKIGNYFFFIFQHRLVPIRKKVMAKFSQIMPHFCKSV